jgi:hypothetical protein
MLNYEPTLTLPLTPPTTHYTLPGGLVIIVVVHQRRHRPPLPPSSPSRGWLLLSAACRHTYILTIVFHRRHNPTNDSIPATSPRPPPPPAIPPPPRRRRVLSALRPLDRPWRHASCVMDRHAALMPSLLVRRSKCRSRTRPPRWDMGPLRQRRRHSPAAGGKPSFASRAAAAGQATATAARQR